MGTLFWTFSRLAFLKGACVKAALSIAFKLFDFITSEGQCRNHSVHDDGQWRLPGKILLFVVLLV